MWKENLHRKKIVSCTNDAIKIVLIYAAIGTLWILFSDAPFVNLNIDAHALVVLQMVKGWVYVLGTSLMLYFLIRRNLQAIHQSQCALRESEARYQAVSELTSDYAYGLLVHPDGTMTLDWIAGAFTAITGYAAEDISEREPWASLIYSEDKAVAKKRVAILLANQPHVCEFRIWTLKGEMRWVHDYARPVWSKHEGRVVRVIGAAQDITDRKQAEMEIADLNKTLQRHAMDLESVVSQRTAELEAAIEQARAADYAKSEFVSNVSHELRTPLTSIKLYLELLTYGSPEKHAEYMDALLRETARLQHLIESLLQVSRLDLSTIQPQFQDLQVNRLVENLAADRRALFVSHGLTLGIQISPNLPPIWADAKLLEQVLTNLLTNALNYTPLGGSVWVRTALAKRDGKLGVTLTVQDTGVGISQEEQDLLFQRFQRGRASHALNVPGTGLGLAISKEIVALHHGSIAVESELGQGSTFTVWLPLLGA